MRLATFPRNASSPEPIDEGDPLPPVAHVVPSPRGTLELLYRTHASRLLKYLSRRAGDEAQDLLHETFARFAHLSEPAVRAVEKPEAYLGRVATNLLRDRARAAARKALEGHDDVEDDQLSTGDPHRMLEDRDTLARLEAAVDRLSPRRRRIFLLHRVDKLTYAEIAETVGMSTKGVKTQMAKALFELRRDVGPL